MIRNLVAWSRSLPDRFGKIRNAVATLVTAIFFLSLGLAMAFLVLSTVARLQANFGQTNRTLFKWHVSALGWVTGIDFSKLDAAKQKEYVATSSDVSMTVFAVILASISILSVLRERIASNRERVIMVHPVSATDGTRDFPVLASYYKFASKLTVLSGDFSFLRESKDLRDVLLPLRQKGNLKLITFRTLEDVQRGLGQYYTAFSGCIESHQDHKIKCSLVEFPTGKVFLYREHHNRPGEAPDAYIYAIRERGKSHALLRALSILSSHDSTQ